MTVNAPHGATREIPDIATAVVKKFANQPVLVINSLYFMRYSDFEYTEFCKRSSYHEIIDMLPEDVTVIAVKNQESLLAYAYENINKWSSIEDGIKAYEQIIRELKELI